MAITNILFAVLSWIGKSELLFAMAVIADDITAAFATVAFVAFISLLVDRTYTATQYALLASLGTAGRTTLASSSGALVQAPCWRLTCRQESRRDRRRPQAGGAVQQRTFDGEGHRECEQRIPSALGSVISAPRRLKHLCSNG